MALLSAEEDPVDHVIDSGYTQRKHWTGNGKESKKVRSIRTLMLIKGRLERVETNLMHFKSEVTLTQGNQTNTN